MPGPEDFVSNPPAPGIPFWAITMVQDIAEIKGKVQAIPGIQREVEEIQKTTVPVRGYEEMERKMGVIWDERSQVQGAISTLRALYFVLGIIVLLMGIWQVMHNTGIHIST